MNNTHFNIDVPVHMTDKQPLKVLSLFSGCGGMDLGFQGDFTFLEHYYGANPFEIVYANDIDQKAIDTHCMQFRLFWHGILREHYI